MNLLKHQVPPEGDWKIWMLLAGRATGKTTAMASCAVDFLKTLGTPGLILTLNVNTAFRFAETVSKFIPCTYYKSKSRLFFQTTSGNTLAKSYCDVNIYKDWVDDFRPAEGYKWIIVDDLSDMSDYYKVFQMVKSHFDHGCEKIAVSSNYVYEKDLYHIIRSSMVTTTGTVDHISVLTEIGRLHENLP